jgi:hypothetical protein
MNIETLLYFDCIKSEINEQGKTEYIVLKDCYDACQNKEKCQILIDADLKRIKDSCKRISGKFKICKSNSKSADYNYSESWDNGGWIGNRNIKYEFRDLEVRQALEIMNNGDCGEM